MNEVIQAANLNSIIHLDRTMTYGTTPNLKVSIDQYNAAEETVRRFHQDIGLVCIHAMRGFWIHGPKGPALPVLVTTSGTGWAKGVYLCMAEDSDTEPMFFLDDGESFAHRIAISENADARQWKYPWPSHQHMPGVVEDAEACIKTIFSRS